MKRKVRNSILLVLTLVMALAMAIGASAASTSYTITVTGAKNGETYKAYKIFDATYDDSNPQKVSYTIDSNSDWYTLIRNAEDGSGNKLFTLTEAAYQGTSGVTTYVVTKNATDEIITTWLKGLSASDLSSFTAAATITADDLGSVELDVTSSGAGYYYVTTTLGSLVSVGTASPTATVQEKNSTPSVNKDVSDTASGTYASSNTASIGDTVYFKSTITDFAKSNNLKLIDTLGTGLTLNTSSIVVTYYSATGVTGVDLTTALNNDNYISATVTGFTIDFTTLMTTTPLSSATENSYIEVTYSATVNSNAVIASTGNPNETYVTYGSSQESTKSTTKTYVYDFILKKTDGSNELSGAIFTLTKDGESTPISFVKVDGTSVTYRKATDAEISAAGTDLTTNIEAGTVTISGLDAGTYILTETTAPDGYNKLTDTITVVIDADGNVSWYYTKKGAATATSVTNKTIEVANTAGSLMPTTGGIGTTIFYVVGALLVLLAVVLLITRWSMSRKENQ